MQLATGKFFHYRRDIPDSGAQDIVFVFWCGQGSVDGTQQSREPCNVQRVLKHAATVRKVQPHLSSTDGNTKFKQLFSIGELP